MKKLSKLALLAYTSPEEGYVFPVAVGFGLVMFITGVTMLLTAHKAQVDAITQEQTADTFGIAEAGVTRSVAQLNQSGNAVYLSANYDPVNPNTNKVYLGADGIQSTADEGATGINDWSSLAGTGHVCNTSTNATNLLSKQTISAGPYSGDYNIKAYRYLASENKGYLLLESEREDSKSRLLVSMQVSDIIEGGTFPGLYANTNINIGDDDILGKPNVANVICADCGVSSSDCVDNEVPDNEKENAIGKASGSTIAGDIFIAELPLLPSVPTPPSGTPTISINSSPSGVLGLPRTGDTPVNGSDGKPSYHYIVDNFSLSGSDTLDIDSSGGRVRLYVNGDISMSGSSRIEHTYSDASTSSYANRLVIFGKNSGTQNFTLRSSNETTNPTTDLMIYAPKAVVSIEDNGVDPDDLDFRGAMWVDTWSDVSGGKIKLKVPDNLSGLLDSLEKEFGGNFDVLTGSQLRKNQILQILTWTEEEAN